jgi:hypothetical protein
MPRISGFSTDSLPEPMQNDDRNIIGVSGSGEEVVLAYLHRRTEGETILDVEEPQPVAWLAALVENDPASLLCHSWTDAHPEMTAGVGRECPNV